MAEPDREAYEAAERLVREAHAQGRGGGPHRRAGRAGERLEQRRAAGAPASPISPRCSRCVDAARGALPPELARQLADALRDLLVAIRAVLDFSIERLDRPPRSEPEVEDIPIR